MDSVSAARAGTALRRRRFAPRVFDPDLIADVCRRHHIRRLALFGSVLRDDFGPASDIDVVVDFEPGHVPGLSFFAIQDELTALAGRPVDLNTWEGLSPYFRVSVDQEAVALYDASRPAGALAADA